VGSSVPTPRGGACRSTRTCSSAQGKDVAEAYALLRATEEGWLISYTRIRSFRFRPLTSGELAEDLAIVDVAAKLDEFERRQVVPAGRDQYESIMGKIKTERWSFSVSGG
jgi:hypothetical protein